MCGSEPENHKLTPCYVPNGGIFLLRWLKLFTANILSLHSENTYTDWWVCYEFWYATFRIMEIKLVMLLKTFQVHFSMI